MSKKKKARPNAVDYKLFVKLWKSSGSVGDVAKALGINANSASAIAKRLRDSGVQLKRFMRRAPQKIDVKLLNKLASGR